MQNVLEGNQSGRQRDSTTERRERDRYRVLREVCERAGGRCEVPVSGLSIGQDLGLSREETFRVIQFLAQRGYLDYVGAGPRVCVTGVGIQYLERDAGRRRSIRGS